MHCPYKRDLDGVGAGGGPRVFPCMASSALGARSALGAAACGPGRCDPYPSLGAARRPRRATSPAAQMGRSVTLHDEVHCLVSRQGPSAREQLSAISEILSWWEPQPASSADAFWSSARLVPARAPSRERYQPGLAFRWFILTSTIGGRTGCGRLRTSGVNNSAIC
jgi:hypothetical protein